MKKRSTKHLKELTKKAVNYYFENSNNSLKHISKKFNINTEMLSDGISKELKKRVDNSLSRKYIKKFN
tara:strand:- start:4336 stop:4539 length:204 start_codon:yes stop_codon:yes gene_type:complete